MNAELKAQWIAALRSGEYKQAQRYLRKDDGFCCLGVLCETAGIKRTHDGYAFENGYEGVSLLYGALDESLGREMTNELVNLNDAPEGSKSFIEIADWIDANIPAEAV